MEPIIRVRDDALKRTQRPQTVVRREWRHRRARGQKFGPMTQVLVEIGGRIGDDAYSEVHSSDGLGDFHVSGRGAYGR